ncbi:MAG TPA: GMC family oxidoreductase [Gemmatimonadaceae bacterium]
MSEVEEFDAIVVGSGAAGGWAAKELTERGLRTMLLEAGPQLDPVRDFPKPAPSRSSTLQLVNRARATLAGQHVQARCMSFSPITRHLFVNDRDNPYRTEAGAPFNWFRARQVGGRLHLWGRNALRIGNEQLHASRMDGYGHDWPISYEDLAPWYERVERFLGVDGSPAGVASIPDGSFAGPLRLTAAERRTLECLRRAWPDRPATTTRIVRHNARRMPLPILAGLETGRLTIRSDGVASRITLDDAGRARGVVFVDRIHRVEHEARGRVVVLCASTIESVRILLNSTSRAHPHGLGNSSGTLGTGLTDHVMVYEAGPHAPLEPDRRDDPYDFGAFSGIFVPSFRNTNGRRDVDFLRGYSLLGSVGRIEPGWFFMAFGEMLARPENRIVLDPSRRDAWGIPVARIRCVHSENEHGMVRDMQASLRDLAQQCGLEIDHLRRENLVSGLVHRLAARLVYTRDGALLPGSAIHEAGGAAMGDDPARSVLNRHNQVWDVPNVFVTDSASFPSSPWQNPALTIMALSARAAHHIADELARRNL